MRYPDLATAGRELAGALATYAGRDDVIVLAIVRGGVPVAAEVARRLGASLDLVLRRGILHRGASGAASAVSVAGATLLDQDLQNRPPVPESPEDHHVAQSLAAFEERVRMCRGERPPTDIDGKTVLLVDDGIKTGATMRVTLPALRARGAGPIVIGAPVADAGLREHLATLGDDVVCLRWLDRFGHVGLWYERFDVPDEHFIRRCFDELAGRSGELGASGNRSHSA